MKKLALLTIFVLSVFGNSLYSYYNSYGSDYRENRASNYYRGEMSTEEYVDSQIGPMNVPKPYHGKLEKHPYKAFGEGYRYSDSEGNQMKIEPNRFGGWDVSG